MEKNIIFCFSGTGNSLKVAKDIAEELDSCEVIIMRGMRALTEKYDRVGFVFPTYVGALPKIVKNFLRDFNPGDNHDAYFFTVTTCGGGPGNTLTDVEKALKNKGLSLSFGAHVNMFSNYVVLYAMDTKVNNVDKNTVAADKEIPALTVAIKNKEVRKNSTVFSPLVLIGKIYTSQFPNKDKGFQTSDKCNSCGLCVNICPVQNITIQNKKPTFAHRCEQCMACIQYCPTEALNYKNKTQTRGRYHHPEVSYETLKSFNETR
jgi:ferredoxin/flavodoxin